jgi:hypothetical protein
VPCELREYCEHRGTSDLNAMRAAIWLQSVSNLDFSASIRPVDDVGIETSRDELTAKGCRNFGDHSWFANTVVVHPEPPARPFLPISQCDLAALSPPESVLGGVGD